MSGRAFLGFAALTLATTCVSLPALATPGGSDTKATQAVSSTYDRKSWGKPSQLGALDRGVKLRAGQGDLRAGSAVQRDPTLNKAANAIRTLLRGKGATTVRVAGFTNRVAEQKGALTTLTPGETPHYNNFVAQKAQLLRDFHRTPEQVTERYVRAGGSVDAPAKGGRAASFKTSRVLLRRWLPVRPTKAVDGTHETDTAAKGPVFVFSPGLQQSKIDYNGVIAEATLQGHEVFELDHSWTGDSEGKAGEVKNAEQVAVHTAAAVAHVNAIVNPAGTLTPRPIVLVGFSMGGGPGALGAIAYNDDDKLKLDGPQMPKGVSAILVAPYLKPADTLLNKGLIAASHVPGLRSLPVSSARLPSLSDNKEQQTAIGENTSKTDAHVRLGAMSAPLRGLQRITAIAASGKLGGHFEILHGATGDHLASFAASRELASDMKAKMGVGRVNFVPLDGVGHVFENDPNGRGEILAAMNRMTEKLR